MKSWLGSSLLTVTLVMSPAMASAGQSFWEGAVPPTPQARAAQAKEWLEGFRTLDRQIPTLSPTENAWLKLEYDDQIASAGGRFTERAIAASGSTEYHKRVARRGLESILAGLSMLTGSSRPRRQDWGQGTTMIRALMLG